MNRKPESDQFSEQFVVRLTPADAAYLDGLVAQGGYRSRAHLVRALLHSIIVDEKASERGALPVGIDRGGRRDNGATVGPDPAPARSEMREG